MPDINEILQDRGKSYGSYTEKTAFVQLLKDEMRKQPSWATMHDGGREALDMIATKIGRLLHGDPRHEDSWVDIGGYADLAAHGDIQDRAPAVPDKPAAPAGWVFCGDPNCFDCNGYSRP